MSTTMEKIKEELKIYYPEEEISEKDLKEMANRLVDLFYIMIKSVGNSE